jgi:hypothetical protein
MQAEPETTEKTERTGAGMLALEESAKLSLFGDGHSHAENPARSHALDLTRFDGHSESGAANRSAQA